MANEEDDTKSTADFTYTGQTDYKRSLAYQHLGIDPKDVQYIPFFRTELRRIARLLNREDEPHDANVRPLELLGSSTDPESCKVLEVYRSVPQSYRRLLPLEAFCQAAGVSPERILENIVVIAIRRGVKASEVLAAAAQPHLVKKTINDALHGSDQALRLRAATLLLKATGFIPTWGWKDLSTDPAYRGAREEFAAELGFKLSPTNDQPDSPIIHVDPGSGSGGLPDCPVPSLAPTNTQRPTLSDRLARERAEWELKHPPIPAPAQTMPLTSLSEELARLMAEDKRRG